MDSSVLYHRESYKEFKRCPSELGALDLQLQQESREATRIGGRGSNQALLCKTGCRACALLERADLIVNPP